VVGFGFGRLGLGGSLRRAHQAFQVAFFRLCFGVRFGIGVGQFDFGELGIGGEIAPKR